MAGLRAFTAVLALAAIPSQAAVAPDDHAVGAAPAFGVVVDLETLVGAFPRATASGTSEEVRLARGGERGGGRAGGGAPRGSAAPSRQPGGYSQGQERAQNRPDRDVDIDVDVDDDRDHLIEDDFVRGAVVGAGVGAAIASDDDTVVYTCPDEDGDGYCDENVAN
ncbi:hypothetical protein CLV78_11915 [Aliiruegeria haliotis]|uniref:Uncharacterized protein n=1 Tax=Aliiruegeria haliotis TaxID=1280846 RepID=A0A2T0REU5_9RHOB|nr:hypothetical protein [Aliiruegeria haliotis]PRY19683.1 hypothetical protein CLV78_11915 [Aliiruegeria haliotis]